GGMDADENGGWLYDGVSAVRQDVALSADGQALTLHFADGRSESVAIGELRPAGDRAGAMVYRRGGCDGWQLGVKSPPPPAIAALLPHGGDYGRWIDRIGLRWALIVGVLVSGAVLTAAYFLPRWAAPLIPLSWERHYGDALVGDFGGKFCAGPGGQEALDALAAKLSPGPRQFDVRVVDLPVVNAAALPGNHIVLFNELLTEADGPDEVAGVLAHEIAHIEHRDVTEAMIRQMGFGLVIASLGGTTGGNVDTLLATRYSRAAEHDADLSALDALARARISPRPTATFFSRLAKQEEKLGGVGTALGYLSTHPMSTARRDLFADAARPGPAYTAALDREQWAALVDICRTWPAAERD
ncbi:MAG TPA: M48 family metallopeptidase, partial [Allosphingosinicella sp.]